MRCTVGGADARLPGDRQADSRTLRPCRFRLGYPSRFALRAALERDLRRRPRAVTAHFGRLGRLGFYAARCGLRYGSQFRRRTAGFMPRLLAPFLALAECLSKFCPAFLLAQFTPHGLLMLLECIPYGIGRRRRCHCCGDRCRRDDCCNAFHFSSPACAARNWRRRIAKILRHPRRV